MTLVFPCRATIPLSGRSAGCGTPRRAAPCRCRHPVMDPDEGSCVMCGRLFDFVIERTWQHQARVMSSGGDRVPALRARYRRYSHMPAPAELV